METVGRWTRPAATSAAALVPVRVVDALPVNAPERTHLVVVTPNGLRVEGLSFEQIGSLIERYG